MTGLDEAFRAGNAAGRPALYRQAVANPPGVQDGAVVNSAAWRAAEIPAVNGHGTAAAVAGFYHALAVGRLLSPGMLAEAVTPQSAGPDRVSGEDNAWGSAFRSATTATAWVGWAETTRVPAPKADIRSGS